MRGKAHGPNLRAQVMAALPLGSGVNATAAHFGLDRSVVSRWKKRLPEGRLQQLATKKGDEFGDLLADYLKQALRTMTAQAKQFADPEWLQRQKARDLAVLYGILFDKTVRILEAAHGERSLP
jgi:hypothetical protein